MPKDRSMQIPMDRDRLAAELANRGVYLIGSAKPLPDALAAGVVPGSERSEAPPDGRFLWE
ncbi:hypothetical protein D3C72_561750 [compost metagenome]